MRSDVIVGSDDSNLSRKGRPRSDQRFRSSTSKGVTTKMNDLIGSTALITGAGRGQGAAHARELAARGAAVALFDGPQAVQSVKYPLATAEQTEEVAAQIRRDGGRAIAIAGDVRSRADLDKAVQAAESEFGPVDMVVANAGIWGEIASIEDTTEVAWSETLAINLTGPWNTIQAAIPRMIERNKGSIVLVSSVLGLDEGMAGGAPYSVTKHGIIGLLRNAALELGPHGITVNAICPGFIDTDMHHWQDAYDVMSGQPNGSPDDLIQAARHYAILKGNKGIQSDEVSKVVAFLLSGAASILTGVIMPVDAGHSIMNRVNQSPVD
ncbi:SDR family NAD(P)-dependent oxidoreductase [Mycolicibacterium diernhoferi]|nr:SDR family NAD(P)-dependent oxidoreductase [Mycolicibacterium diernhoferi]